MSNVSSSVKSSCAGSDLCSFWCCAGSKITKEATKTFNEAEEGPHISCIRLWMQNVLRKKALSKEKLQEGPSSRVLSM